MFVFFFFLLTKVTKVYLKFTVIEWKDFIMIFEITYECFSY